MGVYISEITMPKGEGSKLVLQIFPNGEVYDEHGTRLGITNWAEAVPVSPHGRLIDADTFLTEKRHLYCENCARRKGMKNGKMKFVYDIGDAPCRACGYGDVLDDIDDAPTIIPAEEGK